MSDGNGADAGKRKALPNDVVGGSAKKAREDNGEETAVAEDEVEEFFAILRRIHVAASYFKNGKGHHRKLTERGSLAVQKESPGMAGDDTIKEGDGVKENAAFDLNAEPDLE